MMRAAPLAGLVLLTALAGCAAWEHPRGMRSPPARSLDEQVEARREADAKAKECIIRQAMRREKIEAGRDARPFPKEKC